MILLYTKLIQNAIYKRDTVLTHVSMIWCTSKRSKSWSLHTYIYMQHMHACSTTEGALHDVNYPEMQEAEEERKKTL